MVAESIILSQYEDLAPISPKSSDSYSVEFFHIYTDEIIGDTHRASAHYLKELEKAWDINHQRIIMIDDYNPKTHTLSKGEVLDFLKNEDSEPAHFAFEAALVGNAKKLLDEITSTKLKKNYQRYIDQNGKYPCSLLTASWYLTRLGVFDSSQVIQSVNGEAFSPADRLINILPVDYRPIEIKVSKIIKNTPYSACSDKIQNLFYPVESGRTISLW